MKRTLSRRTFTQTAALGMAGASLSMAMPAWAQARRSLKIGYTGITWPMGGGAGRGGPGGGGPGGGRGGRGGGEVDPGLAGPTATPPAINTDAVEAIFRDVSGSGFHGLELFANQIESTDSAGRLGEFIAKYNLPLVGSYSGINLTDTAQRTASIQRVVTTAKVMRKHNAPIIVIGPNSVPRQTYVFADSKDYIVRTLNDAGKAIMDVGLTPVLHPHTGTCIETGEETIAIMESVDPRFMRFGPDVGQLQKGGADPVKICRDFLSQIHHVHLKDFNGGPAWAGYCPLGQGQVNLTAILDMMEGRTTNGMVMVELDRGGQMPLEPAETVKVARVFLDSKSVAFKN
jgi:inosose dehydratase